MRQFITVALICSAIIIRQSAFAQGPLAPPGAPAPTFRTLQQIEPRVPITSIPFTINVPGSYYLTTNLTGTAGTNGVTIAASDVTLDLSGFLLKGGPGTLDGVVAAEAQSVTVRNGALTHWGNSGLNLGIAGNGLVEGISVRSNTLFGISAGPNSTIRNCVAEGNGTGISVQDGCVVQGCAVRKNTGNGINCSGFNSLIADCSATENGGDGIGASSGDQVNRCTTSFNTGAGIAVGTACLIEHNLCRLNGNGGNAAGVQVTGSDNRIDSNQLIANDQGLKVTGGGAIGNFIVRNSASGNGSPGSSNYVVAAGNSVGVITNVASITISLSNPWVNFEY